MILLRKAHRSLTARTGRIGVSGQHGFIPDGSCAFAALVMDQIRAAAVRGDCDQACCLSADATRAFDKVTFDAVAAGITWCAGSPRDVALTMSFLSGRTMVYGSSSIHTYVGTPQGSILSPFFFLMAELAAVRRSSGNAPEQGIPRQAGHPPPTPLSLAVPRDDIPRPWTRGTAALLTSTSVAAQVPGAESLPPASGSVASAAAAASAPIPVPPRAPQTPISACIYLLVPVYRINYADDWKIVATCLAALSASTARYLTGAAACGISYDFDSAVLLVAQAPPPAADAPRPAHEVGRIRFVPGPAPGTADPDAFLSLRVPAPTVQHPQGGRQYRIRASLTEKSLGYWFCWKRAPPAERASLPARIGLRKRVIDAIPALRDRRIPLSLKVRYLLAYIYPAALYGIESVPRLTFKELDAAQALFTAHSLGFAASCSRPSAASRRRLLGIWPLRFYQGYMASLVALRAARVAPDGLDLHVQAQLRVELSRPWTALRAPDSTLALVARFLVIDLSGRSVADEDTAELFALFVGFAGSSSTPKDLPISPTAGRYWWGSIYNEQRRSEEALTWSAPSMVYTAAKTVLRTRIAEARDADGVQLGPQGPPPALSVMGPDARAWLLLTQDCLEVVTRGDPDRPGLCLLCYDGQLSSTHILEMCPAPTIVEAREACRLSAMAWRWVSSPPRSLHSTWARSKKAVAAAGIAARFASRVVQALATATESPVGRRLGLGPRVSSLGTPPPLGPLLSSRTDVASFPPPAPSGSLRRTISAPVIDMDWSPATIASSCSASPQFDALIDNRSSANCLFSAILSLLAPSPLSITEAHAAAFRHSAAASVPSLVAVRAVDTPGVTTTGRVAATAATIADESAPCGTRELLHLCVWLGLRFEVITYTPGTLTPSATLIPSPRVSTTADGTPLRFAGSLAFWWPDSSSAVGHWEALRCHDQPAQAPPPVPTARVVSTPPSRAISFSRPVVSGGPSARPRHR